MHVTLTNTFEVKIMHFKMKFIVIIKQNFPISHDKNSSVHFLIKPGDLFRNQ